MRYLMSLAGGKPSVGFGFATESDHPRLRVEQINNSNNTVSTQVPEVSITDHNGLYCWRVDGVPVLPQSSPSRTANLLAKRVFDVAGAIFGLILLLPFLLIVGIATRISTGGSALFVQTREGEKQRPFNTFKFRTMYAHATDITGVAQTVTDDPRITPFGRWRRRTSIDELPQLLNVVRGEMSLVG